MKAEQANLARPKIAVVRRPFPVFNALLMIRSRWLQPILPILFLALLAPGIRSANVSQQPFRPEKLAEMDAAIQEAISEKQCPGGVLWLEHRGASYHKAYGQRALVPGSEPMTEDTIFDAASLTKVVACTPAIMLLIERGEVDLDAAVATYIPEFTGDG